MRTIVQFAKADFAQVCKFTAIVWASFLVIYVGQSAFQPSLSVLAGSLYVLPALLFTVFGIRAVFFFARYFANGRDFAISYAKFRGRYQFEE